MSLWAGTAMAMGICAIRFFVVLLMTIKSGYVGSPCLLPTNQQQHQQQALPASKKTIANHLMPFSELHHHQATSFG